MEIKTSFLAFRDIFFSIGVFSNRQIYIWKRKFDYNNLIRWCKEGKLIRLRQSYYTFPELLGARDFCYQISSTIYLPSYISLFKALSFYGLIPEEVPVFQNITSLKTKTFQNNFGVFSYQSVKENLMFGFQKMDSELDAYRYMYIADQEKALLDLLYLYPEYSKKDDVINLRLDEDIMKDEFNWDLFKKYLEKFNSKALKKRAKILMEVYR